MDESEKRRRPIVDVEDYMVGDLVIFTGYLYTPDYVYADQYDYKHPNLGIVVGRVRGYYENILYRVHWLREHRITEVVGGHIRLAYQRK
jgi:hypothetical protein